MHPPRPVRARDDSLVAALDRPAAGREVWRGVGEVLPECVLLVDGGGLIIGANATAGLLLQGDPDALVGRPITDFLPEGQSAIEAGGRSILTMARLQGPPMVVELSSAALPVQSGRRWVVMLRRSDRHEAEAALQELEQRVATISSNLPGLVFQRMRLDDGTIFYPFFSAAAEDLLGYSPEDLTVNGEGCLEIVHWADRAQHLKIITESAASLQPCVEEFRAITRSGEVRWLSGTSRPHRMDGGEIIWDGVLIDVTERKRIELRLEMIMDHAADCIITIDEQGIVETVNVSTSRLFGYSADELVGNSVSMLMPEPFRALHDHYVGQYVDTGDGGIIGSGPRELLAQRKDGSVFPFELAVTEIRMEGHRIFIGVGRDITERKKTEEALRESEIRLRAIAANMPGIVFQRVLSGDGILRFEYVSEGSRELLGLEPQDLMDDGHRFLKVLAPGEQAKFVAALEQSAAHLEPLEEEVRIITPDGRERWLRGLSRPRRLLNGDISWEGIALDVTDRKQAEEKLHFLAYYDPLTGLANLTLFLERLQRMAEEVRGTDRLVAVLSLGIDRFSIINTTLGHAVGDQVLAAAAQRLQTSLGETGTVARAGGDRFLICLSGLTSQEEIAVTVEQLLLRVQDPLKVGEQEFDLTASIGVALCPEHGEDASTLVKNADAALLRAKNHGPGSLQFFSHEMNAASMRTLSIQHRLRRAIEAEGEFVPFFQPQVDLTSGEVVGMEALVRWMSPEGMVNPGEFIPVAEEYGLIDDICEQVLRESCRQNKAWMDAGLPAVPVAVNLSGRQFQQPRRLVQTLEAVLAESGLPPQYLELELTESSAMRDPEAAIAVIRTLNDMGLSCSIDDFGTGYSSLAALKRFPIVKLKIDRSFVMDITTDPNDAAIVDAIVAMAHALRLKVVAEGVEQLSHLDFLRKLRCDTMQGYLFSRPLPAKDMEALFIEGRKLPV